MARRDRFGVRRRAGRAQLPTWVDVLPPRYQSTVRVNASSRSTDIVTPRSFRTRVVLGTYRSTGPSVVAGLAIRTADSGVNRRATACARLAIEIDASEPTLYGRVA